MNIFILDESPDVAARMLCDKHIPKMLLESAQLLCTLARYRVGDEKCNEAGLYKSTHAKHPCQLWLRKPNVDNWGWLWMHVAGLQQEYHSRFGYKQHKSFDVALQAAALLCDMKVTTWLNHTPFAQCMPEKYRIPGDAVTAYRRYYAAEKSYFAKWEKGTPQPQWFTQLTTSQHVQTS